MADPLATGINQFGSATAAGNLAQFQELIREFNLRYANEVAQLYGQNFGPGNPAPIGAATLPAGQTTGGIGYIPGFTGTNAGQTQANLAQQASTAQGAAGLTGSYTQPSQSQYTPGTFVRMDPSTYDTATYGPVVLSYVLPSGQLQRVGMVQAQAMGWNGNTANMVSAPSQVVLALEQAPPSQLPQQTLQGLTTYSNLNTAAQNQAIAQSGVTGMYQAPATVYAPGTDLNGQNFSTLDQQTQRNYFVSNGGDWQAAQNKWVADSNAAITKYYADRGLPPPGGSQAAQETLAAQQQYFTQGNQLAQTFGQYYAPGAPGQAPQAGVTAPQPGQITLAAQQQYEQQQYQLAALAAQLQANPFQQAAVMGQAGRILAGQPTAAFAAPNTVAGVGTAGGQNQGGMGYLQQIINDIKDPTPNQTHIDDFLGQTPTPNKIDSASFLRAAPNTQNLVLQAMQTKYGIDPNDALTQIKNTLPQFAAPATMGAVRR